MQSIFTLLKISYLHCYVDKLREIFLCVTFSLCNPCSKIMIYPVIVMCKCLDINQQFYISEQFFLLSLKQQKYDIKSITALFHL